MDLKNIKWGEFEIGKLFKVQIGKSIDANKVNKHSGKTAYITRKENNNGLDGFINNRKENLFSNVPVITIGNETAEPFVQTFPFYTGTKVNILSPFYKISSYSLSFIAMSLKSHKNKYSYSFTINSTRLKKQKILLPINTKGEPDYVFMEQYMRQKEQDKKDKFQNYISKRILQVKDYKEVEPLNKKEWGEFFIEDIAQIISGKDIYEAERKKGLIPYVSATANNNGIGYFVGNTNETLEENCLSVNRNGSVGYSFYHQYKALFSNDCRKLRLKNKSPFVGKFISRIITGQKDKYGYGYKMGTGRIKRQKILLPVDKKGQPDYEYMEHYIKKLEYEKLVKYLSIKYSTSQKKI